MATDRFGMMSRKDKGGAFASSRVAVAIFVGVVLGGFLAFLHPHALLSPRSESTESGTSVAFFPGSRVSQSNVANDSPSELRAVVEDLKKENQELKFKHAQLEKRLLQRQIATTQQGDVGKSIKAGPVGTMKSQRTFPHVEPDASVNPGLAELLGSVAIDNELVVSVSNKNVLDMLRVWFDSLKRVGVTNFLVIALDDDTQAFCKSNGVNVYRRDAQISSTQKDTGDNHAVSGLKFHLLREFLVLGYSVLLSDVDVVYLQNPFNFLVRDCDVESMTDGFTNETAYGYDDVVDDVSMGWSRYAHTMRIYVFNSGLFYIRPTVASIELLDRVTDRLSKEKGWDQAVFNEELFFPSHPGYDGLHASTRVMDFYLFLNSKVLFKAIRKEARWKDHKPVTIHVNYHPDKYERMLAIVDHYVLGSSRALDRFPDGSEW